jgi:ElaB/YqjD/DUF883 family membrane-anchored ribosome-binding protein
VRRVSRRINANDLETARKVVSRAEVRALEKAEEIRREAEELLRSVSSQAVDTEVKVREQFDVELRALREEMDATSRRATVAESELELVRAEYRELQVAAQSAGINVAPSGTQLEVRPLQLVTTGSDPSGRSMAGEFVDRMNGDSERLMAAASAAAARLHSQAELDLARAKDQAVRILSTATHEAEDLLSAAVTAIERDSAIASASREQAERDGALAAEHSRDAEQVLALATEDAGRLREEARIEAGRVMAKARVEAERTSQEGRREAAQALEAVHGQLVHEIVGLRDAMDRTRQSFDLFLESTATATTPDPPVPAPPADGAGG